MIGEQRITRKEKSPHEARAVIDEEGARYKSMDEARKHLRELIRQNKSMLSEVREREVQMVKEEIIARDPQGQKMNMLHGVCSYKMPKIRVEAKDKT